MYNTMEDKKGLPLEGANSYLHIVEISVNKSHKHN